MPAELVWLAVAVIIIGLVISYRNAQKDPVTPIRKEKQDAEDKLDQLYERYKRQYEKVTFPSVEQFLKDLGASRSPALLEICTEVYRKEFLKPFCDAPQHQWYGVDKETEETITTEWGVDLNWKNTCKSLLLRTKDPKRTYSFTVDIFKEAILNFDRSLPADKPTLFSQELEFFEFDKAGKPVDIHPDAEMSIRLFMRPFRKHTNEFHKHGLFSDLQDSPPTYSTEKSPWDSTLSSPFAYKLVPSIFNGVRLPFDIPPERWFEGTWIVAPSGQGKTNLLEHIILNVPQDAAVILIDAKGELLDFFSHHRAYKDRLVLFDPERPLALNPFALGAHSVELLEYLFSSLLEAAMTPLQSTLFRYSLMLTTLVPKATIETFRDIIQNGVKPYEQYIRQLKPRDQDFFAKEFNSETYKKTKMEIMWRLRLLFSISAIDGMLQSEESKIDLAKLADEGKFICINNNYDLLGDMGAEFFGRFFIALIWNMVRKRTQMTGYKRPVYVVLDEAHIVIRRDPKIATILQQCRAQKVAMIFAHQELQSIKDDDVRGALKNCAIKMANPDTGEASQLAPFLNTDAAFFHSLKQYQFACTVRHKTNTPVALSAPPVSQIRMTDAEYNAVVFRSSQYCQNSPRQQDPPPQDDTPQPSQERRTDDTLYWTVTISPKKAQKGGLHPLQILADPSGAKKTINVTIPPGTRDGTRFRLRGAGIFRRDGTRGDVVIALRVPSTTQHSQVSIYGDAPDPDEIG